MEKNDSRSRRNNNNGGGAGVRRGSGGRGGNSRRRGQRRIRRDSDSWANQNTVSRLNAPPRPDNADPRGYDGSISDYSGGETSSGHPERRAEPNDVQFINHWSRSSSRPANPIAASPVREASPRPAHVSYIRVRPKRDFPDGAPMSPIGPAIETLPDASVTSVAPASLNVDQPRYLPDGLPAVTSPSTYAHETSLFKETTLSNESRASSGRPVSINKLNQDTDRSSSVGVSTVPVSQIHDDKVRDLQLMLEARNENVPVPTSEDIGIKPNSISSGDEGSQKHPVQFYLDELSDLGEPEMSQTAKIGQHEGEQRPLSAASAHKGYSAVAVTPILPAPSEFVTQEYDGSTRTRTASCNFSVRALTSFIRNVTKNFGPRFVTLIFLNYFFVKGAVYVLAQGVQLPYYKEMGVDGAQYQMFGVIALAPWAMKGIVGTVSDSIALGGYHKRYYMIIASVLGLAAFVFLAVAPISFLTRFLWVSPILFFCVMSEVATLDLLIEGKYTEKMREKPEANADLVTFVWTSITLGSLLASTIVGPVNDMFGPKPIFFLCAPLTLLLLPMLFMGFLPERRVPAEWRNRLQVEKIRAEGPFFIVALATAAAALLLAACSLVGTTSLQAYYSIGASVAMILLAYKAMPRRLAHCNLYMYLQEALYVGLSGTLDFWYTADNDCVPDGPNFDYTYYQTYTQWVGHSASIVGLYMFQTVMSRWNIRKVFWVSTVLRIIASLFDYIIVKRWNITYLSISDRAMYLFGDAIILPLTSMLNFMPGVLLTAKLCPKSVESTVYAILAGFSNFGSGAARALGVFFQRGAGIKSQSPHCDFEGLPNLILVCHCLIPLLVVPLTFVLLPSIRLDEPLELDEEEKAFERQIAAQIPVYAPPEDDQKFSEVGTPAVLGKSLKQDCTLSTSGRTFLPLPSSDSAANSPLPT